MKAKPHHPPARLRELLLLWYRANRREMPWRAVPPKRPNPYHVLVSEAMLQQTQVATVIAYFNRFITEFPTVAALAAADEQRVLRMWQGLGYYRRARNLHAAARQIVAQHVGAVPDTVESLATLPGVGRYTAGAIASIAYDRPAPILDGNVARVLARWFGIAEPIDDRNTRDRLWRLAAHLVPRQAAGDFNQAMMELGALICSPQSPRCLVCPIASLCRANRLGLTEAIPTKAARRAPKAVQHHVLALERSGKFFFETRPDTGLWAAMWQMPTIETMPATISPEDLAKWAQDHLGVLIEGSHKINTFSHQTTHRSISFVVWHARLIGKGPRRAAGTWRKADGVDDLPLANPQRKVIEAVMEKQRRM